MKDIGISEKMNFTIYKADVNPTSAVVHTHNNYELNFVESGWGKRYIGDYFSSYEAGDLVLLGPNLPHCWEGNMDDGTDSPKNIVIRFEENFVNDSLIRFPGLEPAVQLFKDASQGIHFKGPLVGKIRIQLEKLLADKGIGSISRLLKIFNLLTKIEDREYLSSIGYLNQSSQSNFNRINRVYEHIFLNFHQSITLKEVSGLVCMTPRAFCRYFKGKTGKTLFEVIKQVRISYACKLIISSHSTISDISYLCGYTTLANFYKQFKELKGISPKQYRKKSFNKPLWTGSP